MSKGTICKHNLKTRNDQYRPTHKNTAAGSVICCQAQNQYIKPMYQTNVLKDTSKDQPPIYKKLLKKSINYLNFANYLKFYYMVLKMTS